MEKIKFPPLPQVAEHAGHRIFAYSQMKQYAIDTASPYVARIAELEAQLEAVGAGGMVPGQKLALSKSAVDITNSIIDAANEYASRFDNDDRQDIDVDVFNAFSHGAGWAIKHGARDEIAKAKDQLEHIDRQNNALRKQLRDVTDTYAHLSAALDKVIQLSSCENSWSKRPKGSIFELAHGRKFTGSVN